MDEVAEVRRVLDLLPGLGRILALKLYRFELRDAPAVPILPCLDHEAQLHEVIAPHAAAYIQAHDSGDLHELVFVPRDRRIQVDSVSTWGECSESSTRQLLAQLGKRYPEYRVTLSGPTWWRGERRVAEACRAQVSLRDVLLGENLARIERSVSRLQTVGALMEKQSRVASWGVRTLTGPLLAVVAFLTYQMLGALGHRFGETGVAGMRYGLIGLLGGVFLYYGLKAVQLTEMANRVWKRSAEYGLILAERRRLGG